MENTSSMVYLVIFLTIILFGCMNPKKINEARKKSDTLIEEIANGNAAKEFPRKYFNPQQTELILSELKNKCDFINRKGNFINDFTISQNGNNQVAFIYEYYLKCDSVRIILTYNLGKEIELYKIKIEPIEKDNFMIRNPEKRLKY